MIRKTLLTLAALMLTCGFTAQDARAFTPHWHQIIGHTIIPGEDTYQGCLLFAIAPYTYTQIITWYDQANLDCEWWHMEDPYYDHLVEYREYAPPPLQGQDLFLGNILHNYYSCPAVIATSGYAWVRWREFQVVEDQWYSAADWIECW